jgi:hypothetical protein
MQGYGGFPAGQQNTHRLTGTRMLSRRAGEGRIVGGESGECQGVSRGTLYPDCRFHVMVLARIPAAEC